MVKKAVSYKDYLSQSIKSPEEAVAFLNAALEREYLFIFALALKDVMDSIGCKMLSVDQSSNFYRILSKKDNFFLKSLKSIMDSLGLELKVQVKKKIKTE